MQKEEHQHKDTSFDEFGDDGELSDAVFCTECGSLNDVGAEVCKSCEATLAEQGNHLAARLRRISRHGSTAQPLRSKSTDIIGDNWETETEKTPSGEAAESVAVPNQYIQQELPMLWLAKIALGGYGTRPAIICFVFYVLLLLVLTAFIVLS